MSMRIPIVIHHYWDYGIVGVLLLFAFPIGGHGMLLYDLNVALWYIFALCFVSEVNGRRQTIKRMKTYYMLPLKNHKKKRRLSIDQMAYVVFTVAVIVFFSWLVVFA